MYPDARRFRGLPVGGHVQEAGPAKSPRRKTARSTYLRASSHETKVSNCTQGRQSMGHGSAFSVTATTIGSRYGSQLSATDMVVWSYSSIMSRGQKKQTALAEADCQASARRLFQQTAACGPVTSTEGVSCFDEFAGPGTAAASRGRPHSRADSAAQRALAGPSGQPRRAEPLYGSASRRWRYRRSRRGRAGSLDRCRYARDKGSAQASSGLRHRGLGVPPVHAVGAVSARRVRPSAARQVSAHPRISVPERWHIR